MNTFLKTLPVYLPGRPIEEVARELGLAPESIIKLASNENALGPSRAAVTAMREAVKHVNLYPDGSAFYLKQKLATRLGLSPAHLILGNGSNEILELIGHALLSPQTEAVVSQYCFAVYPIVTALFGAKLVEVPATDFGHDLDAMLGAITANTRIVFVANPNNPTGTAVSTEALTAFLNRVPREVMVALDEAYVEFLEQPPDLVKEIREGTRPNVIVMRTFSKIYGLAGLRLGYGIANPDLIAELEKVRQPFNVNAIAQAGALAALDDSGHAEKTKRMTSRGLKLYARTFKKMGLQFIPSHANFILVRVGDGQRVFNELQKTGVIVRPMASYRLPEWVRITMGTPKQNERCLDALKNVLEQKTA
jgi:histidinol-phosphate aminotransferase